ncbi:diaminopimelate decarboxylase [Sporosarcina sp. E16_8]|uniref:diaminopimelate decarboxylase n=1 Tax=Sporosarcina sp. E16_8 TaxID=2789295 RepID=UPI002104FD05|nr:diaminopimelate decarboxylase [Sporosarcina sp. E16_8]
MMYIQETTREKSDVEKLRGATSKETVEALENKYGESFYLFDLMKLRSNYMEMFSAFTSRYTNFIIGYSYKTNYLPALIKEMYKLGAYAEVVSRLEYDLALKIGVEPKKIIFNGPLKTYDDIALALENGSILNLDSFYEIDLLEDYVYKNAASNYKVGLRVSFDLTGEGSSPHQSGFIQSRFGFCVENGNLEKAIKRLKCIGSIDVIGFHGHFSTKVRSVSIYRKITQKLCDLSKEYLLDTLEYIDVGGGMYGNVPEEMGLKDIPTFDDYAEAICSVINKEKSHFKKDPLLIIEPGLSIVVDTFKFYSKVIDVKKNQEEIFVLVNGSIHNIKPTMHSINLPMEHVKKNGGLYKKGIFNVVGYTCMERDYLAINYQAEIPKPGDFLVFSNVGAYTIVLDPPFIKERPPIIAVEESEFKIVRKREKLNDFINDSIYLFQSFVLVGLPLL